MSKAASQALLVASVLALVGVVSVLLQQPLLAPSLGSAVFVQVMSPMEPSARPWNTAVGQLVGLVAGFIGVYLAFATAAPTFLGSNPLVWTRVFAVAVAVALTVLGEVALGAISPAGGATAVVVAIGAETADMSGVLRMVGAIAIVTVAGEGVRRIVLRLK